MENAQDIMLSQKSKGTKCAYVMISHFQIAVIQRKNIAWETVHQNINGEYVQVVGLQTFSFCVPMFSKFNERVQFLMNLFDYKYLFENISKLSQTPHYKNHRESEDVGKRISI